MAQILRVTKAFSVLSDPNGHVYTPGELVDGDHPHVRGREGHFETVEAHVSARSGTAVESATSAPGERRERTRPSRKATKKAAPGKAPAKKAAAAPGKAKAEPVSPPPPTGDNAPADPPSSEVL